MNTDLLKLAERFGVSENDLLNSGLGTDARRGTLTKRRKQAIKEAADLLARAAAGSTLAQAIVQETLSTSDLFVSAAGDIFDRIMLAQYTAMPATWARYSTRITVKDFRPKFIRQMAGGRTRLERVPELTPYPSTGYAITERTVSVLKYGRSFGFDFESRINDQLDELMQVPGEFGNACILTENYVSLTQLANPTTGAPNTAFFNVGNGNLGTGFMTQTNVQAAYTALHTKKDSQGNLLYPGPLKLVTGPALELQRERLLNQTELRVTDATGKVLSIEPNPLNGRLTGVTVDDLPGNAWFIVPDPETTPIPAFYTAFLAGYETPDIRYRDDQGSRAGGGSIDPDQGSYENDSVNWRVRHIVGGAQGDPTFTYASDGLDNGK